MAKKNHIPVHSLHDRGKSNFEIHRIDGGVADLGSYAAEVEHRDDYYIFIYQQIGTSNITVDFIDTVLPHNSVFCIQPGQVHFGRFAPDTAAWVILAAAEWVPAEFRIALSNSIISQRPVTLENLDEILLFEKSLDLLSGFEKHPVLITAQAARPMFEVCVQLFIHSFRCASSVDLHSTARPAVITQQFKSLLLSNYRIMKSPAEFAMALNITPAYLNEVVRDRTGYSVSHWIHQEIILEAKRTLFYTNSTSKEIAHSLGYSDPAYFIRLFKKLTGLSPLAFRGKYRK